MSSSHVEAPMPRTSSDHGEESPGYRGRHQRFDESCLQEENPAFGRQTQPAERGRARPPSRRSQSRAPLSTGRQHEVDVPPTRTTGPIRWHEQEQREGSFDEYGVEERGPPGPPELRNPHPDTGTRRSSRSRPPRSYLNRSLHEHDYGATGSKPVLEETHGQRDARVTDEEMGYPPSSRINWKDLSDEEKVEVLRLPLTRWMNSAIKNHFVATLGELVGTTMFLLFAFAGTEVANIRSQAGSDTTTTGGTTGFDVSVLLYISIIFGFSLMVNVWIFFRISGGLFNPAVTLAMLMVRAITPVRAGCLLCSQLLGSMLASVIVRFLFPETFNVRTTLSGGTSLLQGVIIEAILTAELVFTIFMLAKEKHRATFIAPVGIGLALFISEMVGVQFTGGSLNPARSFGPCVITLTFDQEHWIYWVGPMIGSILAVVFYKFIKTLEYEMANPGADGDPTNDPTVNPMKRAEIRANRRPSSSISRK